jgi:hypothetical protein
MNDHWLVRPSTIRRLWMAFIALLGGLVVVDVVVQHDAHFTLDRVFGFGAWFGLLSCGALIVFAKGLGAFLKRPDAYYDR